VRDEFVVLHGVYKEIRLRRGKVVLCIYNESPNYYGRDPKTDTASEIVERTTAEN
jgi:type IV secretion system protein VirB9